jgi:hypothetical protein
VTLLYAAVSLCGVAAAHVDRSSSMPIWMLSYAVLTVVLGLVLHRFANAEARARI